MLLVTVVALAAALVAAGTYRARQREAARFAFHRLNRHVWHSDARGVSIKFKRNEFKDSHVDDLCDLDGQLHTLEITASPVTAEQIRRIGGIHSLTHLRLRATGLTDEGVSHLTRLSSLKVLDVSRNPITDASIPDLGILSPLDQLHITMTSLTVPALRGLWPELPHHERVGMQASGALTTDQASAAGELERFGITSFLNWGTTVGWRNWPVPAGLHVVCKGHPLGAGPDGKIPPPPLDYSPWVEAFNRLPGVAIVEISDPRFTDADFQRLANLSQLRELRLQGTSVTDAVAERFRESPKLEVLALGAPQLSDFSLEAMAGLSKLEELDLSETHFADVDVPQLMSLTTLKRLCLCDTLLTDDGLQLLRNLKQLEQLDLRKTQTTGEAIGELHRALRARCKIKRK